MYRRRIKVKIISIVFAIVAIVIFVILVIFIANARKTSFGNFFPNKNNNSFSGVQFRSYTSDKREINLQSEDICESEKDNYIFKNMISTFTLANGELLTVSAAITKAVGKDKTMCEFIKNVKLSTEFGLLVETDRMFIDFNRKIATGDAEIKITQDDTQLSAKKYSFDMNSNVLTLIGDAKGFSKNNRINADKLILVFDNMHEKNMKHVSAIGNSIYVTETYTLKAKKDIIYTDDRIKARENVVLLYKKDGSDYEIQADSMLAHLINGLLDDIKANGSLTIKTKDATIYAHNGTFKGDKIKVSGNVVVSGKYGNIFGDAAILNVKTGDIFVDKSSGVVDDGIRK